MDQWILTCYVVLQQQQSDLNVHLLLIIIIFECQGDTYSGRSRGLPSEKNHGKNSPLFLRGIQPQHVLRWNNQTAILN
jgi:hypothetical protein